MVVLTTFSQLSPLKTILLAKDNAYWIANAGTAGKPEIVTSKDIYDLVAPVNGRILLFKQKLLDINPNGYFRANIKYEFEIHAIYPISQATRDADMAILEQMVASVFDILSDENVVANRTKAYLIKAPDWSELINNGVIMFTIDMIHLNQDISS